MSTFDGDWFRKQLDAKGLSQAALARHLGLQPSAIVKLFNGMRRLKIDEAEKIGRFLGFPAEEVLRHAGVALTGNLKIDLSLDLIIDDAGNVKAAPALTIAGDTMARLKSNIPVQSEARYQVAQVRSPKGNLWQLDDNLVLFEEPTRLAPGPAGTMSIAKLRDGSMVMGKVIDWRKTGEATMKLVSGDSKKVEIAAATPVLLIVP